MSVIERFIVVFILALFDTLFTWYHITNGATEANPLMDYFLQQSFILFVFVKMVVLTLLPCLFLLFMCTNDFRIRVIKSGFNLIILVYVSLCLYHFYLFLIPTLESHSSI